MKIELFFPKERLILSAFVFLFLSPVIAQPGGVNSGLSLWYDFNDPTTLFQDLAGTVPVTADGESVFRINDLSGNGNNAQLSDTLQGAATYESDAGATINGNSVIRFDSGTSGLGDIYEVPGMDLRAITNQDLTIFTVYKVTENTPNGFYGIWGNDNGAWDRFYMASANTFPGAGPTDGLVSLGGATQGAIIPGGGDVGEVKLLTAVYDGNLVGSFNSGTIDGSKIYFNGIEQVQFTDMSDASNAQTAMRIGNDGDDNYYVGDLAEMIIYNRVLTNNELNLVNCYLAQKYDQSFVLSPGGVASCDLRAWLKVDLGTDVTTGDVSSWEDQSIQGVMATQAVVNQKPEYVISAMNYNPSLLFDNDLGNEDELNTSNNLGLNGSNQITTMVVSKSTSTHNGIIGPESSSAGFDMEIFGGNVYGMNDAGESTIVSGTTPVNDNVQHIGSFVQNGTTITLSTDGGDDQTGTFSGAWDADNYDIGRSHNTNGSSAEIAEIIIFNDALEAAELLKAETYLAIKYGITLDNTGSGINGDYSSSDAKTLWDADANSAYHNDVIGIGRDDIQGLLQKQSHTLDDTSRIYLNSIAASNQANGSSVNSNISYVLMGHNKGKVCNTSASAAEVPTGITSCTFYARLEREWKITKTNFSQNFNTDIKLNSCGVPGSVNTANLRVLIDDDGDFSNGGTSCYFNGDGSGIVISYSNPEITISNISNTHIPDNSTRFVTIGSVNSLTPLPVELGNYTVECRNGQATLLWSTISETNNANFIVERSRSLESFETIGTVQSVGNSTQTQEYSWTDVSGTHGAMYYRLSQVDINGSQEFFGVKSSNCREGQSVAIYPNPFEDEIDIDLQYGGNLSIIDESGRIILQKKLNAGETRISTNTMVPGLYFACLYLDNGEHEIRKIMKM